MSTAHTRTISSCTPTSPSNSWHALSALRASRFWGQINVVCTVAARAFRQGGASCLLAAPALRDIRINHFSYPTRTWPAPHCNVKRWARGGFFHPRVSFSTLTVVHSITGRVFHLRVERRPLWWVFTPNGCSIAEFGGVSHSTVWITTLYPYPHSQLLYTLYL